MGGIECPSLFSMNMKDSKYNTFFEYNHKIIGYNTLYNTCLTLTPEVYGLLKEKFFLNLSMAALYSEKINNLLSDNKFIIDENIDESSIIDDILKRSKGDKSLLYIIINPTLNCNFNCWYCYETHVRKSKISAATIQSIIKYIKIEFDTNSELKNIRIDWFGGEPLMYKDIIYTFLSDLQEITKNSNVNVVSNFTTNGYLITEKFLDFCQEHHVKRFQITLDGNRMSHNKVKFLKGNHNTYDQILQNIKLCLKKGFEVSVRYNISQKTKIIYQEIISDFSGLAKNEIQNLRFSIHAVWQDSDKLEVLTKVDEIVSKLREHNYICVTPDSCPNTIFNPCYADKKNQFIVNYDARVFKCTARNFSTSPNEGILLENGTIQWLRKELEKEYIQNSTGCLSCSIFPICNRGCYQKRKEVDADYCFYGTNAQKMEHAKRIVIEKLYWSHLNI